MDERKMTDRIKAALDAKARELMATPEYAAAIDDVYYGGAGLAFIKISDDGSVKRIDPKDVFIDHQADDTPEQAL